MKSILNVLAAYTTDLIVDLFVIAARKIKKKFRGDKTRCVEANKN
jgi:hypothetical protein